MSSKNVLNICMNVGASVLLQEELILKANSGGSREINKFEDIAKFRKSTGCTSVMVARSAEWNTSIFRKEGKLPLMDMIKSYLKLAIDYDNSPSNTKYCIQNMLRELQETDLGKKFLETQTLGQISDIWDMGDYFKEVNGKLNDCGLIGRRDVCPIGYKKQCLNENIVEMECAFIRSLYTSDPELPKTKLLTWIRDKGYKNPTYETKQIDKLFKAVVTVNDKKYTSSFWEKSKRWAEQGAAIVCLCDNGIFDKTVLKENGVLR